MATDCSWPSVDWPAWTASASEPTECSTFANWLAWTMAAVAAELAAAPLGSIAATWLAASSIDRLARRCSTSWRTMCW